MSEVAPCGGIQSHYISPERGMGDIHGKNLLFGSAKFQAGGPDHFNQFLTEGARFVSCQADGLHGGVGDMKQVAGKTKDISCHQKSKNTKYYFFSGRQSFEEIQDFTSHAICYLLILSVIQFP